MAWRTLSLGLAGLAASAVLIYFAKPIAVLLLSSFGIEDVDTRPQVAEVVSTSGRTFMRKAGNGSFSDLDGDMPLYQRDEVKTEKASRIHLKFPSGYEIEILEESQAILDIWSAQNDRRPYYISFLRGDYRILQTGQLGELYVVLDDEVFTPENRPSNSDKGFQISTEVQTPTTKTEKATDTLPDTVTADPKNYKTATPDKLKNQGTETLSSAYIESIFMSRSALFRRCQLTSLRDNKMAIGNMLFSMVIKPNGRVRDVKVVQNNLNNNSLESCVSSVIERTKFKAFSGAAISLSYPLNFQ